MDFTRIIVLKIIFLSVVSSFTEKYLFKSEKCKTIKMLRQLFRIKSNS